MTSSLNYWKVNRFLSMKLIKFIGWTKKRNRSSLSGRKEYSFVWLYNCFVFSCYVMILFKTSVYRCVAFYLCAVHTWLLYGLYVPDWEFTVSRTIELSIYKVSDCFLFFCSLSLLHSEDKVKFQTTWQKFNRSLRMSVNSHNCIVYYWH